MRRVVSIVLVVVSFGLGAVVRAQAPSPPPDAAAAALIENARRDREQGRLDQAIDGLARAYQSSGDSTLLFSMAEVHREAGHAADALRLFQTYLRRDAKGVHRESAEKQIRELERLARTGAPDAKATGGAKPPKVAAAPAPRAATPAPAAVVPPPPAAAVAPPPASSAPPPPAAPPPSPPPPLAPPPAAPTPESGVVASAPLITTTTVDMTTEAPPPANPDGAPLPRWVPWTLAAVTVALGTGAIVSGLSASSRYDELQDSCGQTPSGCAADDISDLKSRALRANVLWALAGVAAVGTGISVYVNAHAAGASGLWRF